MKWPSAVVPSAGASASAVEGRGREIDIERRQSSGVGEFRQGQGDGPRTPGGGRRMGGSPRAPAPRSGFLQRSVHQTTEQPLETSSGHLQGVEDIGIELAVLLLVV